MSLEGQCAGIVYEISVTVPVGSQATVLVPTFGAPVSSFVLTESGTSIWAKGGYVPGVPGVFGVSTTMDAAGETVAQVLIGSGTYNFQVSS